MSSWSGLICEKCGAGMAKAPNGEMQCTRGCPMAWYVPCPATHDNYCFNVGGRPCALCKGVGYVEELT
jgi:hypothetical protein